MNDKQTLYVITENQYSKTSWYNRIMEGLLNEAARRRFTVSVCPENELNQLPSGTMPILLGSSLPFITECLNQCLQKDLHPIVAGFEIFQNNLPVSYITVNRRQAMVEIIKNLISCGAGHIALLGVNSAVQTDILRYDGWCQVVKAYDVGDPERDVFYSDHGLLDCLKKFWEHYKEYDAVACVNDYYGAYLLADAAKRGVLVPEHLMITGFGNIHLSGYTSPPLTTVALNLPSVGTQVVRQYRNLIKNPELLSCAVTLKSQIITRESTKHKTISIPGKNLFPEKDFAFEPKYEKDLREIYSLENTIITMDELDRKIIDGLSAGMSYHKLAEMLYLSDSAFKYRLYKLFASTGTNSRAELVEIFHIYIPHYININSTL